MRTKIMRTIFATILLFAVWVLADTAMGSGIISHTTRNLITLVAGYGLFLHPIMVRILKSVFKGATASTVLKSFFAGFVIVNEREVEAKSEPVMVENTIQKADNEECQTGFDELFDVALLGKYSYYSSMYACPSEDD